MIEESNPKQIIYKGSDIIFNFEYITKEMVKFWTVRKTFISDNPVSLRNHYSDIINKDELVLDCGKDKKLMNKLHSRISKKKWASIYEVFNSEMPTITNLAPEILKRYSKANRKVNRETSYRLLSRSVLISELIKHSKVKRIITSWNRIREVMYFVQKQKLTLTKTAQVLNMTLNQVRSILRRIRDSSGDIILRYENKIIERIGTVDFIRCYCEKMTSDTTTVTKNLNEIYNDALKIAENKYEFSFSFFYQIFREYGFRYHNIKYAPKMYREIKGRHLKVFLDLYIYFLTMKSKFVFLFIDESSICLSNFKKKFWKCKSYSSVIRSNLKYEKLMLLGAMSQSKLVALQLLHSNFSSDIFLNFVQGLINEVKTKITPNQQIILFLDNCSSHRSNGLLSFCRYSGVTLMYNLPRVSQLNPIEYLWEFLKRPLRKLTDYKK